MFAALLLPSRRGMKLSFALQVLIGEDEPPENALKRFRWASKCTGLVMEVRLRACCASIRVRQC